MITIIMAGGLGRRMNSEIPKVLHLINDKPMLYYVIQNALSIGSSNVLIVVGKYKSLIQTEVDKYFPDHIGIEYIDQPEANGTGHAIKCCIPYLVENDFPLDTDVLILSGDVPLITEKTLSSLGNKQNSILITNIDNPTGCGRILFTPSLEGQPKTICQIVEEKDCTDAEREITYVNCGIYNLTMRTIFATIPIIDNINKSNEYYLTDFVKFAVQFNIPLHYHELEKQNQYQIININTIEELNRANSLLLIIDSFAN
jgi:bifunctional N-acetylglucosamine-1-phosphate-uridyltransferase/glucosamine-1-phosphate-acetyltransferase GlmU-like protein